MSEIEQKRKELQDDVYNSSGDNTEVCSSRDFAEHILEGFNLGVEMARKEFEPKIKEIILWSRQWADYVDDEEILRKWDKNINIIDFCQPSRYNLLDFKKSLGVKE